MSRVVTARTDQHAEIAWAELREKRDEHYGLGVYLYCGDLNLMGASKLGTLPCAWRMTTPLDFICTRICDQVEWLMSRRPAP